ncbi:MAG: isopenicillin N synthase family oxygenase [Actinomycetia bacterium]|nr:isopenicillin N synthase family oxygenase [Actinomycetes bacterium]
MLVPTIDLRDFHGAGSTSTSRSSAVKRIARACSGIGFFQVVGHDIDPALRRSLLDASKEFFALPAAEKQRVSMAHGGRAWRGWFPPGGELTSGVPDAKEGYYFGRHLDATHPAVRQQLPMHGPNLHPSHPQRLGPLVEQWIQQVSEVGMVVLRAMALGLGLAEDHFERWCADPVVLFRIFHYPAAPALADSDWGVAEHTDYGLLTLLAQDDTGGLQVHGPDGWLDVPPDPDALVCNLGDMIERVTGGRYRSTPHRVSRPERDRISMPLFLDPSWDAVVEPIAALDGAGSRDPRISTRWDGESVFEGPTVYGDYLTAKVSRVFPHLFATELDGPDEPES